MKQSRKPLVNIVRCADYTPDLVYTALEKLLGPFDVFRNLSAFKTILIKPNLLSASKSPEMHVNTHPELIRALVRYLKSTTPARIIIGESSSSFNPDGTRTAFKNSRITDIAREYDIELVNFDRGEVVEKPVFNGRIYKKLEIAKTFDDADFIINLPKLKTHELCCFTAAMKNMMGAMPGRRKKDAHLHALRFKEFSLFLVDLYSVTRPHFSIVDGICAMEGNGPAAGSVRQLGLLAASDDAVALDTILCRIIGIPLEMVTYIVEAAREGFGLCDEKLFSVAGDFLFDDIKPFKLPERFTSQVVMKLMPKVLMRFITRQVINLKPEVIHEKCIECLNCVHACPVNCISHRKNGSVIVDKKECQECYCCYEVCPADAIKLTRPFIGQTLYGLKKIFNRVL